MTRWLIIDGNNFLCVARRCRGGQVSRRDREQLIADLDAVVGELAGRITVVFDGRADSIAVEKTRAVEIVYAPAGKTADSVIEEIVFAAPDRSDILVVTSDHMERDSVEAAGAGTMAASIFADTLSDAQRRIEIACMKPRGGIFLFRLGDLFPSVLSSQADQPPREVEQS